MRGLPEFLPYSMPLRGELPSNVVPWEIETSRSVLLIHDMQRYFVRELLRTPLGATLLDNVIALRAWAVRNTVPVAFSAQPGMTSAERGLLRDFWGDGMTQAAGDRDIVSELTPRPEEWVVTKWRYSAFFGNDLLALIRGSGRDQLIICGVYAYLGITISAVESYSNDIETFVVADAIADFNQDRHAAAMEYLSKSCSRLLTVEEVIR